MLKFPYAIRDFEKLITQGFIYMDRTDRIPLIEQAGQELLFLRPRRMGKSLLLSMLMNYYDLAKAKDFERLFGQLAIGQNPTPLHNQYLVLQWDFSEVESHGSVSEIRQSLYNRINARIKNFQTYYRDYLQGEIEIDPNDALSSFWLLLGVVRASGHKLYLFIDEYDNFGNEVLMGIHRHSQQRYEELVMGEGLLKTLFKNLKSAGGGQGLERLFMTGISPIVMSDIASASNVMEKIYWLPEFNDLCGFRQDEVEGLLQRVGTELGFTAEKYTEALGMMQAFYNGSWFSEEEPTAAKAAAPSAASPLASHIYNSTLVIYFLKHLYTRRRYPREMLDDNLAPDNQKLIYISNHPKGPDLLLEALKGDPPVTINRIETRFGVKEMWEVDKQRSLLASLLCYLGGLTLAGQAPDSKWRMVIPNLVMRKLYAERMLELTFPKSSVREEGQDAAERLFSRGELQPLCTFVEEQYLAVYHNRDYAHFNELTLKTLFLALLLYKEVYVVDSEPAFQRRHGDLILLIRPEMRHLSIYDILIEFKYLPLNRLIENKQPLSGEEIQQKSVQALSTLAVVKGAIGEAETQLRDYRQKLVAKYGSSLKVRTYAVIGLGFEKLLWQEVR